MQFRGVFGISVFGVVDRNPRRRRFRGDNWFLDLKGELSTEPEVDSAKFEFIRFVIDFLLKLKLSIIFSLKVFLIDEAI